jgi:hypothetical protein
MADRGNKQAQGAATAGQTLSNTGAANSSQLYGALAPELMSQMAAPSGIDPVSLAKIRTSNMQQAGGTQAGAQGAGALLAGRTRNAGSADAAIADSTRSAGQQLSEANLKTDLSNEKLKEGQRENATRGLESLYGTNTNEALGGLGAVASNVNANTGAENASWDWAKDILDPIMGAASGNAAGIIKASRGGG